MGGKKLEFWQFASRGGVDEMREVRQLRAEAKEAEIRHQVQAGSGLFMCLLLYRQSIANAISSVLILSRPWYLSPCR